MQLRGSRWDENEMMSIYPGVSRICTPRRSVHLRYPSISVHPLSLINHLLGGRNRVSWESHLEAEIEWTQRCHWSPRSSELRDTLRGRDRARLEMHLEAVIERVWRCTCRLWSSEIGEVLGSGRFGGRRDGSWDSIHWLTCICGNVESWVQQHLPRDGKLAGSGRLSILGWWCTWCMLFVLLGDGRVEHKKERDQGRWGKSSWETGTWRISCGIQLTMLDTARMSPNPAGNITDTRSSYPNQASHTPNFSTPLVSSISFSSSSPVSLFLVHNSTIIASTQS